MNNRKYFKLAFLIVFIAVNAPVFAKQIDVKSPDGRNKLLVNTGNTVTYSLYRNGEQVLAPSPLSLTAGNSVWGKNSKLKSSQSKRVTETVNFSVPRKYKSLAVQYQRLLLAFDGFDIEFRLYNDGVAYRFIGKGNADAEIKSEEVTFNLGANRQTYTLLTGNLQNWFEENYTIKDVNALPADSFSLMPVMAVAGKYRVVFTEANVTNYSAMYLQPVANGFKGVFANYPAKEEIKEGGNKFLVTQREDYIIRGTTNRTFPWRVTGVFDTDAAIAQSELVYLLADGPEPGSDFSWVKPGKALWDWWNNINITGVDFKTGINTATYKYMIDFAAAHKLEYLLIDEGWCKPDNLLELNPDVDMDAICAYAKTKNVGIQLWVKWMNINNQMKEGFAQFDRWGVKGIKIDFMDRNDAKMVDFFHRVTATAAAHKMTINFHGAYPPDGLRRKYPNFLTSEGVIGLEYNKWSKKATPHHDLIIPYLRMFAGPMDYTPGAMLNAQGDAFFPVNTEPMSQGTRCHQLAMYVVYESPLQMLSDSPVKYAQNAESLGYLENVPTVWDDTRVLDGKIGEHILMARRSGNTWYIAAMAGANPAELSVNTDFLGEGNWKMKVYADGPNAAKNGKDIKTGETSITKGAPIKFSMEKGGGWVAVLTQ